MTDDTVTSSVIVPASTTTNNDTMELVVEEDTAKYYTSSNDLLQIVNEISLNPATRNGTSNSRQQSNDDTDENVFNNVTTPTSTPQQFLPNEICVRIVQYLLVPRIQMKHITAIGCSSQYIDTIIRRQRRSNNDNNNNDNNSQHSSIDRLTLLAHCLTDDESTWWISEEGLNVRPQYVDFGCIPLPPPSKSNTTLNDISSSLSSSTIIHSKPWLVRLQSVSIKIPPLPYGPMSLREFVLQRPKRHSSVSSSSNSSSDHHNEAHVPDTQDDGEEIEQAKIDDTTPTVEWETISPTWTLHGYTTGYQSFTFPGGGVDVTGIRLLCLSNQISVDDYDHVLRQRHEDGVPQSVGFYSIRFD